MAETLDFIDLFWRVTTKINLRDIHRWSRSKRIFSGSFTRGKCKQMRYQPFKFQTDEGMSDCIYSKSFCNEEGQRVHHDDSAKDDRTCRCDYTKNYAFIITPRNLCYCIPTEEDCSCYIKSCPANLTLSADYLCIQHLYQGNSKCTDNNQHYETSDVQPRAKVENKHLQLNKTTTMSEWKNTASAVILCCLLFMHITGVCFIAVSFSKNVNGKLQSLNRYFRQRRFNIPDLSLKGFNINSGQMSCSVEICHKGVDEVKVENSVENVSETSFKSYKRTLINKENIEVGESKKQVQVEVHQSLVLPNLIAVSAEEIYFLRIIHLLFRVACPVVRMFFNHEIQPNQLRKTLDEKKQEIIKRYRKKNPIINDVQWNLLFGQEMKTSEDFDIRLMIYILDILPNFRVGQGYQCSVDKSINAMLSIIKYIRNDVTQSNRGEIPEKQFNKYWDDIGQAVLILLTSQTLDIDHDQEVVRLIDRLRVLNPVDIDDKTLRIFIYMSERFPAMILQQLISEYCTSKQITIKDLLKEEKHQLHHKRKKADTCCKCKTELSSDYKPISEKEWKAMYEINIINDSHNCNSNLRNCSESFVPKSIDTGDLSVAKVLILNVPHMLSFMISRLCMNGFDTFLMQNKHTLYHSMEAKLCCKCNTLSTENTERSIISEHEWNTLFIKDDIVCQSLYKDCCCQYSVRNGTKELCIDTPLLSKIFHIAGPIGILNKIEQHPLLYFVNWTVDDKPLRSALIELVNMIDDTKFSGSVLSFILPLSNETIADQKDTRLWISKHLLPQKARTEQQLQILIRNEDGLNVKSVQIPKGCSLPLRTKTITDLTTEENNFLLVVYGIIKIIYPLIKAEFDTQCPDHVFEEIRMGILKQATANNWSDEKHNNRDKKMDLTQVQRQLFSRTREEIKNNDFELIVKILKERLNYKWNSEYINQLNEIVEIRREIMYSSSGILNPSNFEDIMTRISKAVSYFRKEMYTEELTRLQHIQNILE